MKYKNLSLSQKRKLAFNLLHDKERSNIFSFTGEKKSTQCGVNPNTGRCRKGETNRQELCKLVPKKGKTYCVKSNVEQNKVAQKKYSSVNQVDNNGDTMLIRSSKSGDVKKVKEILSYENINVNFQNKEGQTALIIASELGHPDVIRLLLQHQGVNVNAQDNFKSTALMWASENGHAQIARLLLEENKNIAQRAHVNTKGKDNFTALILASQKGHVDIVNLLLKQPQIELNHQESNSGLNALMFACMIGNTSIVKSLLKEHKHPININAQCREGMTALIYASYLGHVDVVRLLLQEYPHLKEKIDVNIQGESKKTAFIFAVKRGHVDIVSLLLQKTGNVKAPLDLNVQDTNGETALMYASRNRNIKMINLLLEQKDINLTLENKEDETALMQSDDQDVFLLLARKTDLYDVIVNCLIRLEHIDIEDDDLQLLIDATKYHNLSENKHLVNNEFRDIQQKAKTVIQIINKKNKSETEEILVSVIMQLLEVEPPMMKHLIVNENMFHLTMNEILIQCMRRFKHIHFNTGLNDDVTLHRTIKIVKKLYMMLQLRTLILAYHKKKEISKVYEKDTNANSIISDYL